MFKYVSYIVFEFFCISVNQFYIKNWQMLQQWCQVVVYQVEFIVQEVRFLGEDWCDGQ